MKTRRQLNDEYGMRTVFVVELLFLGGKWGTYKYMPSVAHSRNDAAALREKIYRHLKSIAPKVWTRNMIRIALYVRAE